jgi:ATP-dependent Clp protease ATP-binding subunit ClpX
MKTSRGSDESLRCSFCHKSQDAVAKLISSPSDYPRAYICDECVAVCNSILEDDRTETAPGVPPAHLPKPQEVKSFLDEYVIGQDQTKKKLAVAVGVRIQVQQGWCFSVDSEGAGTPSSQSPSYLDRIIWDDGR